MTDERLGWNWICFSLSVLFCSTASSPPALPPGCDVAPVTTLTCTGRDIARTPWRIPHDDARVLAIKELYIYGTKWPLLPHLANFTRLEGATIYYNDQLQGFNRLTFANLKALRVLRLTSNSLQVVHSGSFAGLKQLKALDLGANHLATVPTDLVRGLRMLRYLHLENNMLDELPAGMLQDATELRHFDVSGNRLIAVPNNFFRHNEKLVNIYLRSNFLVTLPVNIFQGITATDKGSIDLRDNRFSFLPEGLFSSLRYDPTELLLHDNRLACDCTNHWAASHDKSPLVCWPSGNGAKLQAVSVSEGIPSDCQCRLDPNCRAATLPAKAREYVAFVARESVLQADCSRNVRHVDVSLSSLMRLAGGFTIIGRFRRHFNVQMARVQYLFSLGQHVGIRIFALAVTDKAMDVFIWQAQTARQGHVRVLDDCNQTTVGWKKFVVIARPTGKRGELSIEISVNGVSCAVSGSPLSGEVLSSGRWGRKSVVVGASEAESRGVSNCFNGEIARLELYDTPLTMDVASAVLGSDSCKPSPGVNSWCLAPTQTLSSDANSSHPPSTMQCSRLERSGNAYRCARRDWSPPCNSSECENGGTCLRPTTRGATLECACATGFTGRRCEVLTCANCTQPCPIGRTGYNCLDDVDECNADDPPCKSLGKCVNTPGSFVCQCLEGFSGEVCEENVDDCRPFTCRNGAACVDLLRDFECLCPMGLAGKTCSELQQNYCKNSPCRNGGQCMSDSTRARCACAPGFTGVYCESDVDECSLKMDACDSLSTHCQNTRGSYWCECRFGFKKDVTSNTSCMPVCRGGCGKHGSGACVAPGRCDCLPGFGGQICAFSLCTTACSEGSQCSGFDECIPSVAFTERPRARTMPSLFTLLTTAPAPQPAAPTAYGPIRRPGSQPSTTEATVSRTFLPTSTSDFNQTSSAVKSDDSRKELYLIAGILGGVLFILIALALVTYRQRKRMARRQEEDYLAAHAAAVMRNHNMDDRGTMESSMTPATLTRVDTTSASSSTSETEMRVPSESQPAVLPVAGGPKRARKTSTCMVLVHPSGESRPASQQTLDRRTVSESDPQTPGQLTGHKGAVSKQFEDISLEWDGHAAVSSSY